MKKKDKKLPWDLILDEDNMRIYCDTQKHVYFKEFDGDEVIEQIPCGCSSYGIAKRKAKKRGS